MASAWRGSTRRKRLPNRWDATRRRILKRDDHLCRIGRPGCTVTATEVDHIIPGDDHSDGNLRAACHHCNQQANIATRPRPPSMRRPAETHPGLIN
jgi:5-methylcytosine-specific restriction endonuclease McrA